MLTGMVGPEPWKEMSRSSGQIPGVSAVAQTPNKPGLANLFSFPGLSSSLHSQGICSEISSELGPIGWSYVPASKVEEERGKVFVETQNQLEFFFKLYPNLISDFCICLCGKLYLGKKNFYIFFFKAKQLTNKQTNKFS